MKLRKNRQVHQSSKYWVEKSLQSNEALIDPGEIRSCVVDPISQSYPRIKHFFTFIIES